MKKADGVSLQINLSPSDYALCRNLLPYQIDFFYELVGEVVLTIESKKSKGKRFGSNFEKNKEKLYAYLEELRQKHPKIRLVPVDYSNATKKKVSKMFFASAEQIPDKDFRGGPFYCYFFGMYSCNYQKILHLDGDMILGGDAQHWLAGAKKLLKDPSVAFVLPLSGPPTTDFNIKQPFLERINRYTYSFDRFTTRVFLTDFDKLTKQKLGLKLIKPTIRKSIRALIQRNYWEMPEVLISENLRKANLFRIDYWGENDLQGCFSLHPVHKPDSFIADLPHLLKQIMDNNIPDAQKGHYDIQGEVMWQAPQEVDQL